MILTIAIVGEDTFLTLIDQESLGKSCALRANFKKIASNSIVELFVSELNVFLEELGMTYFAIQEIIVTVAPVSFTAVRAILASCYAIEFCNNEEVVLKGVTLNQILLSSLKDDIYKTKYRSIKTIIKDKHGYYVQDFDIKGLKPIDDIARITNLDLLGTELSKGEGDLVISNATIDIKGIDICCDINEYSICNYINTMMGLGLHNNFLDPLPIYVH